MRIGPSPARERRDLIHMSNQHDPPEAEPAAYVPPPAKSPADQDQSLADLLRQMTDQSSRLASKEIELAKAEIELKAKRVGVGVGAFGGAGFVALLAAGALTATLILVLAEWMEPWLAALVVTVVYLAVAGVMALLGRKKLEDAKPPVPERAIENSKRDVNEIKQTAKEGMNR